MQGQPGETVVAHRVTAQQKTRDLVPLQGEHILADTTFQHLGKNVMGRSQSSIKANVGFTQVDNLNPRCVLCPPPSTAVMAGAGVLGGASNAEEELTVPGSSSAKPRLVPTSKRNLLAVSIVEANDLSTFTAVQVRNKQCLAHFFASS